jgi:hypothetical protein
MALPGLVAAKNLADVADRERAWDNLGLNIEAGDFYSGLILDDDARSYLNRVALTGDAVLESSVAIAINEFVVGCKADGIWSAIKTCCILAGARTLNGALVPLVGTAPTNFNFVSGDYNRKTGLVGNGSTKYLNTNYSATSFNNFAFGLHVSTTSASGSYIGSSFTIAGRAVMAVTSATNLLFRCASNTDFTVVGGNSAGFAGASRSNTLNYVARALAASSTVTVGTSAPNNTPYLFARNSSNSPLEYSAGRVNFYFLGESLNLTLLDARVTDLINAFGAAIP